MDVSKVDLKKITILNQLTFLNMTNIPEHSKQKKKSTNLYRILATYKILKLGAFFLNMQNVMLKSIRVLAH